MLLASRQRYESLRVRDCRIRRRTGVHMSGDWRQMRHFSEYGRGPVGDLSEPIPDGMVDISSALVL